MLSPLSIPAGIENGEVITVVEKGHVLHNKIKGDVHIILSESIKILTDSISKLFNNCKVCHKKTFLLRNSCQKYRKCI
jgi:hypothetical protein